jgi:hypothetical protein
MGVGSTVATVVRREGGEVGGTVVPAVLIPFPVGLVQPARSAQAITTDKTTMTRVFCIQSAFIFAYFWFVLGYPAGDNYGFPVYFQQRQFRARKQHKKRDRTVKLKRTPDSFYLSGV